MVSLRTDAATVFQPLASIVPGRYQNSEYYVTYSGSFSHENPRRLLYLIEPTRFCNICFFPWVPIPATRGGPSSFEKRNSSSIISKENRRNLFLSRTFPREFQPSPRIERSSIRTQFLRFLIHNILLGRRENRGGRRNARNI